MGLGDFISSIEHTLEKAVSNAQDSFVDGFLSELQSYISNADLLNNLENLPKDSLFTLDRFEGNYAVCENNLTSEIVNIPCSQIDASAREGSILKFDGDIYKVDIDTTEQAKSNILELFNKTKSN